MIFWLLDLRIWAGCRVDAEVAILMCWPMYLLMYPT
jgi:hypothetical protein